jgi:multicomponent Na+:H+ antiporter subunit E
MKLIMRILKIISFMAFYAWEMLVSSFILAKDILHWNKNFEHGIVAVDIDLKSDMAILAMVNLVSMTPGSLTVELSHDRKKVFIHTMYLDDEQAFVYKIKNDFERRIKEVFE